MHNLVENRMKLGFGMMRLPRTEGTNDSDLESTVIRSIRASMATLSVTAIRR